MLTRREMRFLCFTTIYGPIKTCLLFQSHFVDVLRWMLQNFYNDYINVRIFRHDIEIALAIMILGFYIITISSAFNRHIYLYYHLLDRYLKSTKGKIIPIFSVKKCYADHLYLIPSKACRLKDRLHFIILFIKAVLRPSAFSNFH